MRTTIRIDDELYRAVKERAARSGRTVAAVLEDVVRLGMRPDEAEPTERYTVKPFGAGGLQPGVELSSNDAVREALDHDSSIDALR